MVAAPSTLAAEAPVLAGYRIEAVLRPNDTYLAETPTHRRVVLKRLDDDCLLKDALHPIIRDRLARIRELAHLGVANLYTVERGEGCAYAVWEYVEGQTLEEFMANRGGGNCVPRALGYELAVGVETLHALGIVHGAIHERNVIITPAGQLRLTHISPLLYNEPEVDIDATLFLLAQMGCGEALAQVKKSSPTLRDVATHLVAHSRVGQRAHGEPAEDAGRNVRRRTLIMAAVVALIGASISVALWNWSRKQDLPGDTTPTQFEREHASQIRKGPSQAGVGS